MKRRRKPDGSEELIGKCPLCNSQDNFEVNTTSFLFHCWACGHSGKVRDNNVPPCGRAVHVYDPGSKTAGDVDESRMSRDFPDYVYKEWEKRGLDIPHLLRNYAPLWDGERVHFPILGGTSWKRSVFPWDLPKVRSSGIKGILVPRYIPEGASVVITEGDYKAVSIPTPWVGVAIGGTSISSYQKMLLSTLSARSWIVALDGGKTLEAEVVVGVLRTFALGSGTTDSQTTTEASPLVPTTTSRSTLPSPLRRFPQVLTARLPEGKGPDDVPRRVLLDALRGLTPPRQGPQEGL